MMADSGCFMQQQQQPFSYSSMEGNLQPIHALGQSVSFGRFMSESLAWEKWSTFSHNRYVEEAEKYSRPGSVAQKKAFFEAHYKKIAAQKAAALLEQANASSNPVPDTESQEQAEITISLTTAKDVHEQERKISSAEDLVANANSCGSDFKEEKFGSNEVEGGDAVIAHQIVEENPKKVESKLRIDRVGLCNELTENEFKEEKFGSNEVEGGDAVIAHQVVEENPKKVELKLRIDRVRLCSELTENEFNQTPQMDKSILKSPYRNPERSINMFKKKTASSKLQLFYRGASKIPASPAKITTPIRLNNATPTQVGNKYATESADKRKSTPRSLRMAVNFTPIRELNKLTSTVMRKIERSRVGSSTSKAAKDCSTPLRTPNTASKTGSQNHPSATPWSEKKRNKLYSPFSFTPFSLRTEERAARRKEKLEEKFNKNESQQKVQLQTKLKEKAETEIRKLRQSFCFKARPLPDFYKERKTQKNTEVSMPLPQSIKLGRKTNPNKGEGTISQSGHRPPNIKGKNLQGKTHSLSLRAVMCAHENTSPNIQ